MALLSLLCTVFIEMTDRWGLFFGKYRKILLNIAVGLMALILISFFFRSPAASWYLHRWAGRFNQANNAELRVGKVRILGLASIRLTGISLRPAAGDTLFSADTIYASIGILKLFAGRLSIHDVRLINARVSVISRDSVSNWRFLFRHGRGGQTDTIRQSIKFNLMAGRILDFAFDKIPLSLEMRNFRLLYSADGHDVICGIEKFDLRNHFFRTVMTVAEDSSHTRWALAGMVDNHERKAEFRIYPEKGAGMVQHDTGQANVKEFPGVAGDGSTDTDSATSGSGIRLPVLAHLWQAAITFDTLAFGIQGEQEGDGRMALKGFASIEGLTVDQRRIAASPVHFDKLSTEYLIRIGEDHVELDSATTITFNRIDLHPYAALHTSPSKRVSLRIHKPWFNAQDLFSSLPRGLFTTLDGIVARGRLAWHLDFDVDPANPDSLLFDTSLDRMQFSVVSYGSSNLSRINEPFIYTAFEHDQPVRTFEVGPGNPDFRTLGEISHYLQSAVMTSEDGGFYQHRGFLPDAFRESIITNIRERRFARGGSTISMQLVKNVFLSRNKTIARKLEEALIVWLIENQGLCTKERMFEVYLNIIEWGPLIYGAQEASRFYFNKDASKLTLAEAIFMASIIPRPKSFRWSFDDRGHLRESNAGFYRLVSEKMVSKGWITTADAEKLIPDVELRGPAKKMLKGADTSMFIIDESVDL